MKLLERFLRYVAVDTQSDGRSEASPSTPGQTVLLEMLAGEMRAMGMAEVAPDARGYVTGTVPATEGCEGEPVVGFLAHVDTSPDAPGRGVMPQLIERDGDVVITSDGTTLLGADDKAGVAEIMTAVEYLLAHPEIRHGRVRIAFTSDEEIGRGVDGFDVEAFGADFAYTVDGGGEGELEYENFNAASAKIKIRGRSAHPGDAKGRMLNALRVALEFDSLLPAGERPETTEGYEGFYHLMRLDGTVECAEAEYIVRDHDRDRFEARKRFVAEVAERLNCKYGKFSDFTIPLVVSSAPISAAEHCSALSARPLVSLGRATPPPLHGGESGAGDGEVVELTVEESYYNMREVVERHPEVMERARRAMRAAGVEPVVKPIRGGTDGARLSFMGLPCPNIFSGAMDMHGRDEHVSLRTMEKAVETIVGIVRV